MKVLSAKLYCCILLFYTLCGFSYGQTEDGRVLSFSVYGLAGLGNLGEYVYSGEHTLSYLEWDLLPVGGIGIDAEFTSGGGFYIGGAYESFLPGKTGIMEDSDWTTIGSDYKTNYSSHNAYLTGGYRADLRLGVQLLNNENYRAVLYLGYLQKYITMEGRDGYLEYPPGSERVPVYGVGIAYTQFYRIPHLGLQFGKTINRRFIINFHGRFSPFTFMYGLDHHYKRDMDFYDSLNSGVFFKMQGELEALIAKNQYCFLALSYSGVPEFRGSSFTIDTDTGEQSTTYQDSGGASYSLFQLILGYRIKLTY